MRIETIEIKNFRQYRNVKFDFTRSVGTYDIHIVLGKNGTGKSNMLNAITWCLYGDELHLGDKNVSIDKLNSEAINEARVKGIENITLEVSMTIKTDDVSHPKMNVTRSVTYFIGSKHIQAQEESLNVQESNERGDWESYALLEDKNSTISRHIPQQINEYIFFDGEQLEKYFQSANRLKLQEGINNLTQVTLIQQAIEALNRYDKTELTPKIKKAGNENIRILQEKINNDEDSLKTHKENLEELKNQKSKITQRIEELNYIISNNEQLGEKKERYAMLENKLDSLNIQRIEKAHELMIFVREQYVLFGLYTPLMRFYKYIKSEAEQGNLPPHFDKALLQEVLTKHKCVVCGQSVEDDVLKHVQSIIDKINVSSNTAAQLNQAYGVLKLRLDDMLNYPLRLKSKQDDLRRIDNEIHACENDIAALKRYLDGIPGQEQILKAINEKEIAVNRKSECDQKIGRSVSLCEQVQNSLELNRTRLQEAMRKQENLKELSGQLEYLDKCRDVLKKVKEEMVEETREKMEKETFEIFQNLIWKKDAFSRVEIDENYTFKLFDKYGNQTLGACSAAERALLALSFTLALQDVSGHSSLLYIDTPIGRVDSENRENFMKNLLNVSEEKQVILTFTPTEYDYTVREILDGNTSSFVRLTNTEGVTSIITD